MNRKIEDEDDSKIKDKQQNNLPSTVQIDLSKYKPFTDEIRAKNLNSPDYLAASIKNAITPQDSIIYNPKNIILIPTKYPNSPLPLKSDTLEKFSDDTLFFIFFIQQDLDLKYQVFKELKSRGWMFHKKYNTFFQLQGAAKTKSDEAIEGKFKYFDHEQEWMLRQKKDYKLELKYIENIE